MAFSAIAVITTIDDSDADSAAAHSAKWTKDAQGVLDFAASLSYETKPYDNVTLGNNIFVTYDADEKTYVITGTLKKQSLTADTAFKAMWPSNTKCYYGLSFAIETEAYDHVVVGNGTKNKAPAALEDALLYIEKAGTSTVTIIHNNAAGVEQSRDVYKLDFSGVKLAETVATPYVALANTNALAGVGTADVTINGTDGATGKFTYTQALGTSTDVTLVLDNYKGNESFQLDGIKNMKVILKGENSITVDAYSDNFKALGIADRTLDITSDGAAKLNIIVNKPEGSAAKTIMGIGAAATTIGNTGSAPAKITINSAAPYAGLYTYALTLNNADITATSGEKAINVNGPLVLNKSTITASLSDIYFNGLGSSYRFGLRVNSNSLTVDADSVITTQGLGVTGTGALDGDNDGKIYVSGGYLQTGTAAAGLQIDCTLETPLTATKILAASSSDAKEKVYVIGDVETKGLIEVVDTSGKKVQEVIAGTADAINNAVKSTEDAPIITAVVTGDISLAATMNTDKTLVMTTSGDGKISGTIQFSGDSKNVVTLSDVKGMIAVSKGSIRIEVAPWTGGTITLSDEDVVKISGVIDGPAKILYAGDKAPKVIVEEGDLLVIKGGASLELPAKATLEVYGAIVGEGTLTLNGNANVMAGGEIAVKAIAVNKTLTAKAGSIVATPEGAATAMTFGENGKVVAMSGSDINGIKTTDIAKLSGKDATSGEWSVTTAAVNTLNLSGYEGTYNFGAFAHVIDKIVLEGVNKVTYVLPEDLVDTTLFGGYVRSITAENKSTLEIHVDYSEVSAASIGSKLIVIDGLDADELVVGKLMLDQVSVLITVEGANVSWTADDLKKMNVIGILAEDLDVNSSSLGVTIKEGSDLDESKVFGITSAAGPAKMPADMKFVSSDLLVATGGTAINADNFTAMNTSTVIVRGLVEAVSAFTVSNYSTVAIDGDLVVMAGLDIKTDSELIAKNAMLNGQNSASVVITGDALVTAPSTLTNNGTFVTKGLFVVLGDFINNGTYTNEGILSVPAKVAKDAVDQTITITNDATKLADNAAMVKTITFTVDDDLDGSGIVDATVVFDTKTGVSDGVVFKGIIEATFNGKGYTLTLENEVYGSQIVLSYDSTKTGGPKISKDFTILVKGTEGDGAAKKNIITNATESAVAQGDLFTTVFGASGATFQPLKGTVNNENVVSTYTAFTIGENATFEGSLIASAGVTVDGTLNGNISATSGEVTIGEKGTMKGDIVAKEAVTVNGKLGGNITTDATVTIGAKGEMGGDITNKDAISISGKYIGSIDVTLATGAASSVTGTGASILGTITYNSAYKANKDDTTTTPYKAAIAVAGTGTFKIELRAGSDATAEAEVVPGYFAFTSAPEIADPTKETLVFALGEGRFLVDSSIVMPEGSGFEVEAGTTFEILKGYEFDVRSAALSISKDATAKIDDGSETPVYGVVKYIMKFDTSEGYTNYSNAAFALSHCDEGAILTVGSTTTINTAVSIKKGVNIIVDDGVVLTFNGNDVIMEEGAKITLSDTGSVVFVKTSDNKPVDKDTEYKYYTVSGTFCYGENTLVLDGVRFSEDSTIYAIKESSTEFAKLGIDLTLNQGKAVAKNGLVKGNVALDHTHYYLTKADEGKTYSLFSGEFGVAADCIFEAVSLTDVGSTQIWSAVTGVVYTDYASLVVFEGAIYLTNNTTVNGVYLGSGTVVLAEGKTLTIENSVKYGEGDDEVYVGPVFTGTVADGLIFSSAYDAVALKANTGADDDVIFTSVAATTSEPAFIKISGKAVYGEIEGKATTVACFDKFEVMEDVVVIADAVYIIDNSKADGKVATFALSAATGKTLTYDTTYEDSGYTVYTAFKNIDLDVVTELTITANKSLTELGVESKLDLSGKDFTLNVAEGKTLVIDKILIIGTPRTDLGDTGSVISGKIVIVDDSYIVAYSDVDILDAEFKGRDSAAPAVVKEVVYSTLDIEDVPYAMIIAVEKSANTGIQLSRADKAIVPDITGYNFTKWYNYDDNNASFVGETNAYAGTKAILVTVVAKYAPGVTYYMNGIQYDFVDMEKKVEYGSTFTAKITDSGYQGTPLVNGSHTFVVTDSVELQVTGVSPVPEPQPEPEPEVGGVSLTDILLIVLVVLIAIMVVILVLRLNRS
jgi:cytoskeletal protein CcmA (bactofilin family)